ncbi:MAG: SWIM zinc finger family protein [Thermodesulfobacteriota bacterium]
MTKKKTQPDPFAELTWNDLVDWAGDRIVSRGKGYQSKGRVRDPAVTEDGGLVAWVDGTKKYAVKVVMTGSGLPDSVCTCPYEFDCKHGVAALLEYLRRIEAGQSVSGADRDDPRLKLLEDKDQDDEEIDEETVISPDVREEIGRFLQRKTKAQIIDLVQEIAQAHPGVAREIVDRQQLASGDTQTILKRLRREIRDINEGPYWHDPLEDEKFMPDYTGIFKRLEALLHAGHADEVVNLGRELLSAGVRLVEDYHDEGEEAMELAACMPVVVRALEQSSLDHPDRLHWALDAVLDDPYDLYDALAEYLYEDHPESAWSTLADRLLQRLKKMKLSRGKDRFRGCYERNRLSDWAIHALERAGREDEIVPLCKSEAKKTDSYRRLVNVLVSAGEFDEAKSWIHEGIRATENKLPGIADGLRGSLREIYSQQENWPVLAAIQVEEFVRHPSQSTFEGCKDAASKAGAWQTVRQALLQYLEKGDLPWKQKGWPLPDSGLEGPKTQRKQRFPMAGKLIEIALLEEDPERVLYWYDRLPKKEYGWPGVDDNEVAEAVKTHAPDRAVSIWQRKAEQLIAQVKPKAYQQAGGYLRKAAGVMKKQGKQKEWQRYLQNLREKHARKTRLMEVLDTLEGKPVVKKQGR